MATCDRCNRQLTDPESIARGRGPVCASGRCASLLTTHAPDAAQGVLWAHQLELGLSAQPAPDPPAPLIATQPEHPTQLALDLPPVKRRA